MENTRETVGAVVTRLQRIGILCDLFGGWAEEVLGLRAPSVHGDIDMVYRGESFKEFDAVLQDVPDFEEVPLKRFRHKRAFRFFGTLCEVTLVQERERPMTMFWGDTPFLWDSPFLHGAFVEIGKQQTSIVSASNLIRYRKFYRDTQPHRWQEQQALEPYA